jgi:hypothetical protein
MVIYNVRVLAVELDKQIVSKRQRGRKPLRELAMTKFR